jgi:hypothetical protein
MKTASNESLVSVEHPELHHYTGWNGLEGIWTTGTLFATHFNYLNDRSEVRTFIELLNTHLRESFSPELRKLQRSSFALKREIRRIGGLKSAATHFAKVTSNAVMSLTFEGSFDTPAYAIPYIASFCSHTGHTSYERDHGLLSQWRGYGPDERYAIVFDTVGLESALTEEGQRYVINCYFHDVIYNDDRFSFVEKFSDVTNLLVNKVLRGIEQSGSAEGESRDEDSLLPAIVAAAARIKHRGFREENEIRIVECPTTIEMAKIAHQGTGVAVPPTTAFKQTHYRSVVGRGTIPFIKLFDWREGARLPIRRIIVGPHRAQKSLIEKVEYLVRSEVPVRKSETPFIG